MSEPVKANTPKPGDRGYKRSWKNLLINKRYQLQFTLFMVGLAALLMVLLGYRVMSKANEATTVSKVGILGETCPSLPVVEAPGGMGMGGGDGAPPDGGTDAGSAAGSNGTTGTNAGSAGSASGSGATAGSNGATSGSGAPGPGPAELAEVVTQWCTTDETDTACVGTPAIATPLVVKAVAGCDDLVDYKLGGAEALKPLLAAQIAIVECEGGKKHDVPAKARRGKPILSESSIQMTFTLPEDFSDAIAKHWTCEIEHAGNLADLDRGRLKIFLVLLASGLVLLVGLGVYGIKMTHKVAGPLFKVSLYLGKMRDGRLDKVYNLRKGDQLVSFYDHFKTAHQGVVDMEKADIAQLQQVIAAAETAGAGDHAAIAELRAILARKEKTIE